MEVDRMKFDEWLKQQGQKSQGENVEFAWSAYRAGYQAGEENQDEQEGQQGQRSASTIGTPPPAQTRR